VAASVQTRDPFVPLLKKPRGRLQKNKYLAMGDGRSKTTEEELKLLLSKYTSDPSVENQHAMMAKWVELSQQIDLVVPFACIFLAPRPPHVTSGAMSAEERAAVAADWKVPAFHFGCPITDSQSRTAFLALAELKTQEEVKLVEENAAIRVLQVLRDTSKLAGNLALQAWVTNPQLQTHFEAFFSSRRG